jgi:hypothetical protein
MLLGPVPCKANTSFLVYFANCSGDVTPVLIKALAAGADKSDKNPSLGFLVLRKWGR